MMRLWRGERVGSPLLVLVLVLFLIGGSISVGLTISYRQQANRDHKALVTTTQVLDDFRQTVVGRCLQRQKYDQASHDSVVADERYYAEQLRIIRAAAAISTVPQTAAQRHFTDLYLQSIARAQARKHAAAAAGVIGSCSDYTKDIPR